MLKKLFRSYCSSLYCCSLWYDYRKSTYKKLTVAFNNILRRTCMLCLATMVMQWKCNVCKL